MDYATGNVEIGIPGASYSGPKAAHEWISVEGIGLTEYSVEVVCVFSESKTDFSLSYLFTLADQTPIADAGPDQIVYVAPPATTAEVLLDGSGSYDPDGDPLTYNWTWDGSTAYGANATVELPLGTTTVTLVVNDGIVDSEPDTVDITVIRRTAPGPSGPAPSDTTPPTTSNVSASNITKSTADIRWRTNEKSTSQVEYWASPSMLSPLDETYVTEHHVQLTGLTPDTTYHYKVMSRDKAANLAVSSEGTFTTMPGVAVFTLSGLLVSPSEVYTGESVTISVQVANTGDGAGNYSAVLKINGAIETTKQVAVPAGASGQALFTVAKNVTGTYSVEIGGLTGSFIVKEKPAPSPARIPINWPLVGGIIGAVVVAGGLAIFFVRRRKKAA